MVAIEKIVDVERAARADDVTNEIRMAERDVGFMVGAETRAAGRDPSAIGVAPGEIENVVRDHVFVGVMSPQPIGGMDRLIVETFEIDRVRATNGDATGVDEVSAGVDEVEVFALAKIAEGSREENEGSPAPLPKTSISKSRLRCGVYQRGQRSFMREAD